MQILGVSGSILGAIQQTILRAVVCRLIMWLAVRRGHALSMARGLLALQGRVPVAQMLFGQSRERLVARKDKCGESAIFYVLAVWVIVAPLCLSLRQFQERLALLLRLFTGELTRCVAADSVIVCAVHGRFRSVPYRCAKRSTVWSMLARQHSLLSLYD